MKRQATREGETRLYYSGMAQAMLLDRLLPEWKSRILQTHLQTRVTQANCSQSLQAC